MASFAPRSCFLRPARSGSGTKVYGLARLDKRPGGVAASCGARSSRWPFFSWPRLWLLRARDPSARATCAPGRRRLRRAAATAPRRPRPATTRPCGSPVRADGRCCGPTARRVHRARPMARGWRPSRASRTRRSFGGDRDQATATCTTASSSQGRRSTNPGRPARLDPRLPASPPSCPDQTKGLPRRSSCFLSSACIAARTSSAMSCARSMSGDSRSR